MSDPRAIHSSAPVRIDLAGGTVDLWPLYVLFPGALTVNVAIEVRAHCWIRPAPRKSVRFESRDQRLAVAGRSLGSVPGRALRLPRVLAEFLLPTGGYHMTLLAEAPAGSGLGGSSALAIAIARGLAAWGAVGLSKAKTVEVCRNAEARVLGVPTGDQDYHPALWGGLVGLHFGLDGVTRERLAADVKGLERHLLLGYSGVSRNSGLNNWDVYRRVIDRDKGLMAGFERIVAAAQDLRSALLAGNWAAAATAMDADWSARSRLAPGIRTTELDRIERAARRAGAQAAKVCGAGGGGCIAFLIDPAARDRVEAAIRRSGGQVLPSRIARQGVRIRNEPPPDV